jgi:hypothetical protein
MRLPFGIGKADGLYDRLWVAKGRLPSGLHEWRRRGRPILGRASLIRMPPLAAYRTYETRIRSTTERTRQTSTLRPGHGDEYVILLSALGATMHLSILVSDPSARKDRIAEALALLDTKDAAIVTYAQTHDLPEPQEIES